MEISSTTHVACSQETPQKEELKLPFKLDPPHVSLASIKIQDVKTDRGLSVWLVENNDIPVVTCQLMFADGGSKNEPKGKRGLLTLLAALMDEGAGSYKGPEFKKFLIENNIDLVVNQTLDTFIIGFSVPKTAVKQAFQAVKLILTQLRLDPHEIDKLKSHLHLHYRQLIETQSEKAEEKLSQVLIGEHPYVTTVEERLDDLEKITREDMFDFIQAHFTKDRLIASVCGSISPSELKTYIDDTLKTLPEQTRASPVPDVTFQNTGTTYHVRVNIPQSTILFAHSGFKRNDPDYFAFDIAFDIFGSGELGSRLMQRIREDKGLVYGIGTMKVLNRHAQIILGRASTRTQTVNQVMELIRLEWKKFIEKGITQDELKRAKQRSIGVFPLHLTNTQGIVSTLTAIQYYRLGIDYLAQRTSHIEAVTLDHVNRLLKERFKEELTFVIGGKELQEDSKDQKEER